MMPSQVSFGGPGDDNSRQSRVGNQNSGALNG